MTFLWRQSHKKKQTKKQILQIFAETMLIFKFMPESQEYPILMGFLLIMKENDNYNIHKKFHVHCTNIFGLRSKKQILWGGNHPLYP